MNTFSPSATRLIRMDHSHVLAKLQHYRVDLPAASKRALVRTVCLALDIHAQLMDELVIPALAPTGDAAAFDLRRTHQAEMRRVIAQLRSLEPADPRYDTLVMALMRDTLRQVADDEAHLLPLAERTLKLELNDLGAAMVKRRFQLTTPGAGDFAGRLGWSLPASAVAAIGAVGLVIAVWWRFAQRPSARLQPG